MPCSIRLFIVNHSNFFYRVQALLTPIFLLFLFASIQQCEASSTFYLSNTSEWISASKHRKICIDINGKTVTNDTFKKIYSSHYPGFDTIAYSTDSNFQKRYIIVTRFHPAKHYMIVPACCEMFDIFEESKGAVYMNAFRKQYIPGVNFDSTRINLNESAIVSFMLTGNKTKDTIAGLYGDWGGVAYGYVLQHGRRSPGDRAFKGFFSSNISYIMAGTFKRKGGATITPAGIIEDIAYLDFENLETIACRFFHGEHILATYNGQTKTLTLKIE